LVLDELGEGVAVGAEGEAGEAQVLALPRPEPLPVAEAGEAEERHSGDPPRREIDPSFVSPPAVISPHQRMAWTCCRKHQHHRDESTTTTTSSGRLALRFPGSPLPYFPKEARFQMEKRAAYMGHISARCSNLDWPT